MGKIAGRTLFLSPSVILKLFPHQQNRHPMYLTPATGLNNTYGIAHQTPYNQPVSGHAFRSNPKLHSGVGFSGLEQQTYHVLEPIFRATSNFVWDLMIVDTIALWIPRIINAMNRGAITTPLRKVMNEPENKHKSSFQNIRSWMAQNIKGRNWPNAIEETWREIQSAPMVLLFQSMFFGATHLHDPAKRAVLLSKTDIQGYQQAFVSFFAHSPDKELYRLAQTPKGVRKLIGQFTADLVKPHFQELWHQPVALKYIIENAPKNHYTWFDSILVNRGRKVSGTDYQEFLNWYLGHFKTLEGKPASYGQVVRLWLKDWNRALSQGAKHQETNRLETIFGELVKNHNETLLPHLPKEIGLKEVRVKGLTPRVSKDFLEQLEKVDDLIRYVAKHSVKTYKNASGAANNKSFQAHFANTAQKLSKTLTVRKMWYSLGILAIVTVTYFASSIYAQSHNAYPANRLFNMDGKTSEPQKSSGKPDLGNQLSRLLKETENGVKL